MANVWGYWDCTYCRTKTIRGDKTDCPNCGHGRDENVKFYMRNDLLEYVPPEQTNWEQNWICSYCKYQNSAQLTKCDYCGASKTESEKNYSDVKSDSSELQDNNCNSGIDCRTESESNHSDAQSDLSENMSKILKIGIISFIVVSVIMFLVWLFIPVQREMVIDSFSWNREIQIEQMRTVDESDWSLPDDARLSYTNQEIRKYDKIIDHYETKTRKVSEKVLDHYETVKDGYRDLGNGQFEEVTKQKPVYRTEYRTETYEEPVYKKVPVYDTKYYYEIDRWFYLCSANSNGTDKEPYWKILNLKDDERESKRTEHYYIHCIYNDNITEYEIPFDTWNTLEVNQCISFKTFRFSNKMIGEIEMKGN